MKKYDVHGLKELNSALKKLSIAAEKKVIDAMTRAGAQVVRKAAIANAGVDKKDILVRKRREYNGKSRMSVGPHKDKFYLMFKEFGTAAHEIKSDKKVLSDGTEVFGKVISHPGQPAVPWLRPALDDNIQQIFKAMQKRAEKRIEAEAKKARR